MLTIRDLRVVVDERPILAGASLRVRAGELHVLMGPNGSGKSTLAQAIAGNPRYVIAGGSISFDRKNLLSRSADERARLGLFVAFQHPLAVSGVSLSQFLRVVLEQRNGERLRPSEVRERFNMALPQVGLPLDVLDRELNVGFSGGEQKRFELAQLLTFGARIAVLDEIDSGLDVDGVRRIAAGMDWLKQQGTGTLLITHNPQILSYLSPDAVHVLIAGKLAASGDSALGRQIADKGYRWLRPS